MALTKEKIIQASESLQSKNINPTMSAIREILGGGSYATISPILREWKASKEQRATVAVEMPIEAKLALESAGVDIWKIITDIATERLLKVQAESEELINSANLERNESLIEIERLELDLSVQGAKLSESVENQGVLNTEILKSSDEIKTLKIKLDTKEQVENDNKVLSEVNTKLIKEATIQMTEKIKLLEKSQWYEMNLQQSEKNLASEKEELLKAKKTIEIKETELVAFTAEKTKELSSVSSANNSLKLQVEKNQLALDQSVTKTNELKEDIKELKSDIKAKDSLLLKIENQNGLLSGELKATKKRLENK